MREREQEESFKKIKILGREPWDRSTSGPKKVDWKFTAVLNAEESEDTFQVTDDFWGSGHSREMWWRVSGRCWGNGEINRLSVSKEGEIKEVREG